MNSPTEINPRPTEGRYAQCTRAPHSLDHFARDRKAKSVTSNGLIKPNTSYHFCGHIVHVNAGTIILN